MRRAIEGDPGSLLHLASDPSIKEAFEASCRSLLQLIGPALPAAAEAGTQQMQLPGPAQELWTSVATFFFDPRMQWDEKGNILLDPQGNPLPDNLWTQFVAVQATLISRLDKAVDSIGVPQSFGVAIALYTLGIRAVLYPFVKSQLETTSKIQILAPRVNEIKEKFKDKPDIMNQEVGMLYMDLQIDPLGAIVPLFVQLPIFWGLYRAIRRLAIVQYPHLSEGFLWIPSLFGPNFQPDPSFSWLTQWQGPLIHLQPTMGWTDFGLYSILPLGIFFTYKQILKEQAEEAQSSKILLFLPFLLAFVTSEMPQAMGIYIATNIASSVALTAFTKAQIAEKIPGYEEFVKTGKFPAGVDPEVVIAQAFGVKRLTDDDTMKLEDPVTVPEAVFAGRADFIPRLLTNGRDIDEFDNRGIPASAYSLALNSKELLERLIELGANPKAQDKRKNTLLHYMAGYGRVDFYDMMMSLGLKEILNEANEDGQTPLDVARMNLSQDKVADDVRKIILLLNQDGAEGKATRFEDEASFEEAREKRKREESVNQARAALKALAMTAAPSEGSADSASKIVDTTVAGSSSSVPSMIGDSLDRVRTLDMESLKQRLGNQLTEEQLQKLSKRLASMSPQELANYAAGLPVVKAAAAEASAAAAAAEEEARVSVIVD